MFLVIHVVEAFVRRVVGLSVMRHGSLASAVACWTVLERTAKSQRNVEFSDNARKIRTIARKVSQRYLLGRTKRSLDEIHADFITFNVC